MLEEKNEQRGFDIVVNTSLIKSMTGRSDGFGGGFENHSFLDDDGDNLPDHEHKIASRPDPHGGGRSRSASTFNTFMNLLKSYMGSGILGLPAGFKHSGYIAGVFTLLTVGFIAGSSNLMLVQCKQALASKGVVSFSDVAVYTYGKKLGRTIDFLLIFTQFGFCCVYLVIVSENLHGLIGCSRNLIILCITPIFILLSYIPSLDHLGKVSLIANFTLLFALFMIVVVSISQIIYRPIPNVTLDIDEGVVWGSLPVMFGISVYAYEGIGVVLPSETAIKKPQMFVPVLVTVMSISLTNYLFFGAICYLAFGTSIRDEMTDQLAHYSAVQGGIWPLIEVIVRVCLVFSIAATYPVQLFVVTDIVENGFLFKGKFYQANTKKMMMYIFRATLVICSMLIAWLIPNFGPLVGLIGAFGSSSLQFIAPALFYLKIFPEMSKTARYYCWFLIAFGGVGGIMGTVDSMKELIESLSED